MLIHNGEKMKNQSKNYTFVISPKGKLSEVVGECQIIAFSQKEAVSEFKKYDGTFNSQKNEWRLAMVS